MGFRNWISGRKPEPAKLLEDAIERLQMGITVNLTLHYRTRFPSIPPSDAVLLAACVLAYAIAMEPPGEHAPQYQKSHAELVRDHALELAARDDVAKPLSHLYAAITILLAIRTGNPSSELSMQLGARATELSLCIPNSYDICGTDDGTQCLQAIATFAVKYLKSQTAPPS